MKVSAIMPAYNRGYVIGEAIASVLKQTFDDFELIVVDDGSTDNTREVVARFADSRVRTLRHSVNRGSPFAYNTGFREARGEYISILDSDDLWKPEKLAKDVDFLERHAEVHGVFTDLEKEDGAQRAPSFMRESPAFAAMLAEKGRPREAVFAQREMYLCLLREVPVKPTSFTFRRAVLEEIEPFDESCRNLADWDFILRFSKRFRFGYIDEPLAILRVQSDATHRRQAIEDKSSVLCMLAQEAHAAPDAEIREAAQAGCRDAARHLSWAHLVRGQRWKAAAALLRGFWFTHDAGLLVRAVFALVRLDFHKARGEEISFPDSDDIWKPAKLARRGSN